MTTRGPMTTRLLTACTVVLVAITATGCVRFTAPDSPPQRTTAITPTPTRDDRRQAPGRHSPRLRTDNCNRLASLRPIPLPEPGQMPPRTRWPRSTPMAASSSASTPAPTVQLP